MSDLFNSPKYRVVIPLDGVSTDDALLMAKKLKGQAWGFKVNDLLMREGVEIVRRLKEYGGVFADAKLADIPNTVANGVGVLQRAGADLITVHASGGLDMLVSAVASAANDAGQARILAVTVLTSLSREDCLEIYGAEPRKKVLHLAELAASAGVYGVVCSPEEICEVRSSAILGGISLVIPGIRPDSYDKNDDQSRIATPRAAIKAGAKLLVIGRPITQSADPLEALKRINDEIDTALAGA